MSDGTRLEVITREGWRKEVPLPQTIVYVGSHPSADVYLPAPEVSPRHLQFVPSPTQALGYRLINLSTTPSVVR
ncbi:MAG: FHA domain-containing protein, partial [Caldilineaceae bacterium]